MVAVEVCSDMSSHPHHIYMPKCTELLISCLCYQAVEQEQLIKWFPLSDGHPGRNVMLAQVALKTYPVRFDLTLFCPNSRFENAEYHQIIAKNLHISVEDFRFHV